MTTPEYYPLTLNSLTTACNQKSNREPEMALSAGEVLVACNSLQDRRLVQRIFQDNSRVEHFRHRFDEHFPVGPAKKAILCELFLRGPQTMGELRSHTARMTEIPNLDVVSQHLDELAAFDPPYVMRLERQPGQKDARYAHLFCGQPEVHIPAGKNKSAGEKAMEPDKLVQLEKRVTLLEQEMARLKSLLTGQKD